MDHACNICGKVFAKASNWKRHLEQVHKCNREEIQNFEINSKLQHPNFIWCNECGRTLKVTTRDGLRSHIYNIHKKKGAEAQNFIAELEKANLEKLSYLKRTQVRILFLNKL